MLGHREIKDAERSLGRERLVSWRINWATRFGFPNLLNRLYRYTTSQVYEVVVVKTMAPVPQPLPRIISAEEIIPTTKRILEEYRAVRNAVSQSVTPSTACFENVVQPLIDVENRTQGELGVISMLRYASPEQAAREASDEAVRLMGESDAEFTAREDLYLLVKAVTDKAEHLDVEAAKYLGTLLTDFRRCGHGVLNGDQIKSYLNTRLTTCAANSTAISEMKTEGCGSHWRNLMESLSKIFPVFQRVMKKEPGSFPSEKQSWRSWMAPSGTRTCKHGVCGTSARRLKAILLDISTRTSCGGPINIKAHKMSISNA